MPAVVQLMAGLVDGFDVASTAEMKVALDTIMPSQYISIAGPGKRPAELSQAIAAGISINIESANELETLPSCLHKAALPHRLPFALIQRLN